MAFKHLPLVQVYSFDGDLLWERRLDDLEPVRKALLRFQSDGTSCDGARYWSFANPVPVFADWLASNGRTMWLFLKSGAVVRLAEGGSSVELFRFPERSAAALRHSSAVRGELFIPSGDSIVRLGAARRSQFK